MKSLLAFLPIIMTNLVYAGLRARNWKPEIDDSGASSSIVGGSHAEAKKQDWSKSQQSVSRKTREEKLIARTKNIKTIKKEQQQPLQTQLRHDEVEDNDVVHHSLKSKRLNVANKIMKFRSAGRSNKDRHENIVMKTGDIVPFKGNLLETLSKPSNNFILSFKLFPRGTGSDFTSIIRYTSTSNSCCNYGDRWLAFWLHPNSFMLSFVAGIPSNGNQYVDTDSLLVNKWNDISVEAIGDSLILYVNGVKRGQLSNENRPQLEKVDAYAGEKFGHDPADVVIRDYMFTPVQSADFVPHKGRLIETIINPTNNFILSFKLFPWGVSSGYASIIRYTSTSNNCCDYGDRWLAMWLHPNSYKMHIVAGIPSDGNQHVDTDSLLVNKWNDMRIEGIGNVLKFSINGVEQGQLSNENRPQLDEVNMYVGDKFYNPANVVIRNLLFDYVL